MERLPDQWWLRSDAELKILFSNSPEFRLKNTINNRTAKIELVGEPVSARINSRQNAHLVIYTRDPISRMVEYAAAMLKQEYSVSRFAQNRIAARYYCTDGDCLPYFDTNPAALSLGFMSEVCYRLTSEIVQNSGIVQIFKLNYSRRFTGVDQVSGNTVTYVWTEDADKFPIRFSVYGSASLYPERLMINRDSIFSFMNKNGIPIPRVTDIRELIQQ